MKTRPHRIAAGTWLLLACSGAMAAPHDSPEALRQGLLEANSRNDVAAAQQLLCEDEAEPEVLAVFRWLFARDAGIRIMSAIFENTPAALPGEEFAAAPEGLLRLYFDRYDRNGEPNPEKSTAYPYGKVDGTYCFLVPL